MLASKNRYHASLLSTYFIVSKFESVSECDVALEQYHCCNVTVIVN